MWTVVVTACRVTSVRAAMEPLIVPVSFVIDIEDLPRELVCRAVPK